MYEEKSGDGGKNLNQCKLSLNLFAVAEILYLIKYDIKLSSLYTMITFISEIPTEILVYIVKNL